MDDKYVLGTENDGATWHIFIRNLDNSHEIVATLESSQELAQLRR